MYDLYQEDPESTKMECNIFIKDSMVQIPIDETCPLIMVGTGTGVTPFIGHI